MLLTSIPDDVVMDILQNWVDLEGVVWLDTACCSRNHRSSLVNKFARLSVKDNLVDIFNPECMTFYNWVYEREMSLSVLSLNRYCFDDDLNLIFPLRPSLVSIIAVNAKYSPSSPEFNTAVADVIGQCDNLIGLQLTYQNNDSIELINQLRMLPLLKKLEMKDRSAISLPTIASQCKQLEELSIMIKDTIPWEQLLQNNPTLRVICTTESIALPLIEAHCPNITTLKVQMRVDQFTAEQIANLILSKPIESILIKDRMGRQLHYEHKKGVNKVLVLGSFEAPPPPDSFWNDLMDRVNNLTQLILFMNIEFSELFYKHNGSTLGKLTLKSITPTALPAVLKHCNVLDKLQIFEWTSTFATLSDIFDEYKSTSLKQLILNLKHVDVDAVIKIIKSCSQLQYCRLADVEVMNAGDVDKIKSFLRSYYEDGNKIDCAITFERLSAAAIVFENGHFIETSTKQLYQSKYGAV